MTLDGATVYVLDDDPSFVRSMVRLLGSFGCAVQGFTSPAAFLERDPFPVPACALLDLRMPGVSGLEVQRTLAARPRRVPVIFVSGHADVQAGVEAMKVGAIDFLPKPVDEQQLLDAVQRALERDVRVQAKLRRAGDLRAALQGLTPEERGVCDLVVEGLRDDQIAARLGWTAGTVRQRRARVMAVLGVESLIELVRALDGAGPQ